MNDFVDRIKKLGVCKAFADKVENVGSKKQLMDVALSVAALPWICENICKGNITPEEIAYSFSSFINGRYVRREDGYTSAIFCNPDTEEIVVNTTAVLIIGFYGRVVVPKNHVCEVHLCKSNVRFRGKGHIELYAYDAWYDHSDVCHGTIIYRKNPTDYGLVAPH